jgi:hypothetical protein
MVNRDSPLLDSYIYIIPNTSRVWSPIIRVFFGSENVGFYTRCPRCQPTRWTRVASRWQSAIQCTAPQCTAATCLSWKWGPAGWSVLCKKPMLCSGYLYILYYIYILYIYYIIYILYYIYVCIYNYLYMYLYMGKGYLWVIWYVHYLHMKFHMQVGCPSVHLQFSPTWFW